jgi:hypothetical protein
MKWVSILLALVALGTGAKAAYDWYRSSQVVIVPTWGFAGGAEPADALASQMGWLSGLVEAGQTVAALNKTAAVWTGATAVLSALASVTGALSN